MCLRRCFQGSMTMRVCLTPLLQPRACTKRLALATGLQGGNAAPARLHRMGSPGMCVEDGGRSLPNAVPRHQDRPEKVKREAYDAGPQNSNGTTMGQVLTAGPQSAQPEGAQTEQGKTFLGYPRLVSGMHVTMESRGVHYMISSICKDACDRSQRCLACPRLLCDTSSCQVTATPAASAKMSTRLPMGCPPLHQAA